MLLTIEGLEAGYGRMRVLHGIDLGVDAGQCACIIGPNGAGKSTVLKAIFGQIQVYGGAVRFAGDLVTGLPPRELLRRGIAYVPQGRVVFPSLTVQENLAVAARAAGLAHGPAEVEQVLAHFPALRDRLGQRAGGLSGGQQQMVALGLGACSKPAAPEPAPQQQEPAAPAPQPAEQPQPEAPKGPILIGFINHLTGDAAVYGQSMKKGTEVALKEINAAGGINGQEVKVIFEDDKLDSNQAIAAANKLIQQDKVSVIMGSGSSSLSLAIAPIIQEAGALQISSVSTNPDLAQYKDSFFTVMPSDLAQGAEWAAYAQKAGITEAAVMYINNDYGLGVKNIFVQNFTAAGGKVLAAEGFPVGDTALQAAEVPQEAGAAATEGFLALSVGFKAHDKYKAFEQGFTALHNEPPTIWADFAYDTTYLVVEAIKAVGTDPQAIKSWIAGVKDLAGATGPVRFGDDGFRAAEGAFQLYVVKGGNWEVYTGQ